MTPRQQKFCDEYLISGNGTDAAIKAGYSPKTAKSIGQRLLTYVDLRTYIDDQFSKLHDEKIASADEVLKYLTSVMRGEYKEEVPVLCGEGCQELLPKEVGAKDRIKAAELLAKRYAIFSENMNVNVSGPEKFAEIVKQLGGGLDE